MAKLKSSIRYSKEHVDSGLYKFREYRSQCQKARVKDILMGRIYFSTCPQLNDPFEFKVSLTPEEDARLRLKGIVKSAKRVHGKKLAPAKRLVAAGRVANQIRTNPDLLETAANRHYERMQTDCFIFCMSDSLDHPLLWSHYADSHHGLSIGFDCRHLPFSAACQVAYTSDYPVVTYPFEDDFSELTSKGILTKAEYWSYEKEYRLFSVRMDNPSWHLGLKWLDDHRAEIDTSLITSVTFGAKMPAKEKSELAEYCAVKLPAVSVQQCRICDDRFAIEVAPYA